MGESSLEGRGRLGRRVLRIALVISLILCVAFILFYRPIFLANWGETIAGHTYRSRQPDDQLKTWIQTYQLRSVLNLRGGAPFDAYYANEVRATEIAQVNFYDLPMKATRRPSRLELSRLVEVLKTAPRPLLIHCKSGSDRTGLACALDRLLHQDQMTVEAALTSFTIWHGHIPWGGPEHLHEPLHEYQTWLDMSDQKHSPKQLITFLSEHYRDPQHPPGSDIPRVEPGSRWDEEVWHKAERWKNR